MPPRRSLRDRLPRFPRPEPLPSLYDRYPHAATALRRPRGIQVVPVEQIVGTMRHPTQNTADFLPLPSLRGRNWNARWQRIQSATKKLSILPAVELVQVGDEFYVADGHNRVAAAIRNGAAAVDADVTELVVPGGPVASPPEGPHHDAQTLLLGSEEVRQAVAGGQSRTLERRSTIDKLRREELTREPDSAPSEPPPGTE
jgi:hypothetical protein